MSAAPISAEDLIFAGANGKVMAVHQHTGVEAWRNELPGTNYGIVTLLHEFDYLFAGTTGHVLALHPTTGAEIWRNDLPGLGLNIVCLTTNAVRRAKGGLAVGSSLPEGEHPILFVGTHGFVAGLDARTGRELWRTSLPSTGYTLVSILHENNSLIAASQGKLFGMLPRTGELVWNNDLAGMGYAFVCLNTVAASGGEETPATWLTSGVDKAAVVAAQVV